MIGDPEPTPALSFDSSSPETNQVFAWARGQALAYAFDNDPVGPWYEAALPGREAFCMRDVSHQAMGAHALGLAQHTRNMLSRFAENVTEARDWCSLWEVDRHGDPPPADYLNDDEFWFCLPANFDVLDCCYRMYTWTGDKAYLRDPVFLDFYRHTVYEHVERWDLAADKIMTRKRLLNVRGDLASGSRLKRPRGIPGYDEGAWEFTVGFDLLAAMAAGYLAYARIQEIAGRPREAAVFHARAAEVRRLIDEVWWDPREQRHFELTDPQGKPVHGGGRSAATALYWRVVGDRGKLAALIRHIEQNAPAGPTDAVEEQSHLAEVLYRYDARDVAFRQLVHLSRCGRREYPEVSYSVVGAVTTGLMGIEVDPAPPAGALATGMYVDRVVATTPRIPDASGWAQLSHLPVRANLITVRHDGMRSTTLTNERGPALIWRPRFLGALGTIAADGGPQRTRTEEHPVTGEPVTTAEVVVGAGESITAEPR